MRPSRSGADIHPRLRQRAPNLNTLDRAFLKRMSPLQLYLENV